MPEADPLALYNAKRDFAKTAEPAGTLEPGNGNLFMVQKHDATRLHWDLRLEVDGVLKSWAVTRGPSLDPAEKRLAVRTEDHPLSYATFEGRIPAGEYGGGTVMLWDRGTWSPIKGKSAKDLAKGHLHFILDGERMKGEWLLIRLKPRAKEKRENWLLRKIEDGEAGGTDTLVEDTLTSIATGRTMAEIADDIAPPPAIEPGPRLEFRPPQLCTLVDTVPTGSDWLHEIKYDGYRAIVSTGKDGARVYTRSGLDWTDKFFGIAQAAAALPHAALIDGEVVAFKDGRPDFSTLKDAISNGAAMTLIAFDLLALDGQDLTSLGTIERKTRLRAIISGEDGRLQFSEHVVGSGEPLFEQMCTQKMEGIVSKRAAAPYCGKRSKTWVKAKCTLRQEFVIVGWLPSDKAARGFKSLLLGVHRGKTLIYAGKVGTGFDHDLMDDLRGKLDRLARKTPPIDAPRAAVRGAHWVTPKLVAEIAYAETTPDGVLRHSSFLGLREDKDASEVVAETPAPSPRSTATASTIKVSNPDRVIFPDTDITKGELADYVALVAPIMLPWTGHRPISLVRCPQGRAKACFFQKHDAGSFGDAVHQTPIVEKDGATENYLYVDDTDGLVACVQMGSIEFHGWGSSVATLEQPDRMVFDLDPDEGLDFNDTKAAAAYIKGQLAELGLTSYPMLSGGKGVHVVVPLRPQADWLRVKDFADRFARALSAAEPERFTATMSKAKRKGKIFIDWLRNQRGSTSIMPYSARARAGAPVAAPVAWSELRELNTAARWHVTDGVELIERANSRMLEGWGISDQLLPNL